MTINYAEIHKPKGLLIVSKPNSYKDLVEFVGFLEMPILGKHELHDVIVFDMLQGGASGMEVVTGHVLSESTPIPLKYQQPFAEVLETYVNDIRQQLEAHNLRWILDKALIQSLDIQSNYLLIHFQKVY
jgi:hypothetical protein